MTDWGIKISKPGVEVGTASLPNLYFTSQKPILKTYMVSSSTYTFESDLDTVDIEITHNLGYTPMVWFSISGPGTITGSDTIELWGYYYSTPDNKAFRYWTTDTDSTKAYISYGESNVSGAGFNPTGETWNFKTYIFYEQGA